MGGGRLRESNHMGSLFPEEVPTHLRFVYSELRDQTMCKAVAYKGLKTMGNYKLNCHPKK